MKDAIRSSQMDDSVRSIDTASTDISSDASSTGTRRKSNCIKSSTTNKRQPRKGKKGSGSKDCSNERAVSFGQVNVLEFSYTLAHGSVTDSEGPPVGLSSNLVRSETQDIDSYELETRAQNDAIADEPEYEYYYDHDGKLRPETRYALLLQAGFSRETSDRANEESTREREYRQASLQQMHNDERNERKERARRRLRRWTNPKNLYIKGSHLLLSRGSMASSSSAILAY